MKTTYSIEFHKPSNHWTLWKNAESEHSVGSHKVFSGTKKECRERLEKINGTGTGETKSSKQRIRRKQSITSRKNKTAKKRVKEKR